MILSRFFFNTNIRIPNSYHYLGHCENKTGQPPAQPRHFYDMKTTWKDFQSCSKLSRSRRKKFPLLKQERNPSPMTTFKVGYVIVSISYKQNCLKVLFAERMKKNLNDTFIAKLLFLHLVLSFIIGALFWNIGRL